MPLDTSVFPGEVQLAFFMYNKISDKWDGMSGSYMGKNWEEMPYMLELYDIDNKQDVVFFMQQYDLLVMKDRFEEAERKRKQQERKSGGGKTYTHNIQG
jgi:hypothetical protein|tara:strand:- start:1711 stop:2007 length:297 start_codon:yes stop_codon:yes gene_type:complete